MVQIDGGAIEIQEWVIHDIPQNFRHGDQEELHLSEAISPSDPAVARFFEQKISESFSKSCHPILAKDDAEVPDEIQDQLRGNVDLLQLSVSLAQRLYGSQTAAMSAGLLVAMKGQYRNSEPMLAVLKLEKEKGARAEQEQRDGKSTYTVQYLTDLFLTNRTRVFKVGIFTLADGALSAWITDPQSRGGVAQFFLEDFLQCELARDPRATTKAFHASAESFINTEVTDPTLRARYENAVLTELHRNTTELNLSDFAKGNLEVSDRDRFRTFMRERGVDDVFVKDTSDIKSKINRIQYEFQAGVKVNVPTESRDTVNITELENGLTELRVEDSLNKVRSRGA